MLIRIPLALFTAMVLSWFGFDSVVLQGMFELFKVDISTTGYYFMFGLVAMLRSILPSNFTNQERNK